MIITYPHYLAQTQIIGPPNHMLTYHGLHIPVSLQHPLCISLEKSTEYEISIRKGTCS